MMVDEGRGREKDLRMKLAETWTAVAEARPKPVELEDSAEERARQAEILARENQLNAQQRTRGEIGRKFSDPREDPEELQDYIDELERRVFQLDAELRSLRASGPMRFPSAGQIADLANAMNFLEARITSADAANALMSAANDVMDAFGL